MKKAVVLLAVVAILAVAGAVVWAGFGRQIRTASLARRVDRAWEDLEGYKGDVEASFEIGSFSVPMRGTVWHMRPDSYRFDLGGKQKSACTVYVQGDTAWLHVPGRKVAYEVQFETGAPPDVMEDYSMRPWLDQARKGNELEFLDGERFDGRDCTVVEIVPTQTAKAEGVQAAVPALGKRFDDALFLNKWKRTRIYIDEDTDLPIRAIALKENGGTLFSWAVTNLTVDGGLDVSDFAFEPPQGTKVRKRKYDPNHPESLFLPPEAKDSTFDKILDVVEDGLTDGLKDVAEQELREAMGSHGQGDPMMDDIFDKLADEL